MRARRARVLWRVGAGTAAIAGLVGAGVHHEYPFLLPWLGLCAPGVRLYRCEGSWGVNIAFGLLCAALLAAYVVLLHRWVPVRRVMSCRSCGGRGWILNLEPDGRCPRCGGDRFDARIWRSGLASAGTVPWVAPRTYTDVEGVFLLAKRRAGEQGYE